MEMSDTTMNRKDITVDSNSEIKNFIVDNFLFGDSDNLNDETDLFKKSIVDSTGILELIAYLETTFNLRVEDDEIIQDNFCSIKSIKKYIETKKAAVTV
jgi:acyl carrier protein